MSTKRIAVLIVSAVLGFLTVTVAVLAPQVAEDVILSAKRSQLANEFNQVQTAVLGYYTEYSVYPAAPDNATLVRMLLSNNPRGIAFLTVKASDLNAKGEMLDPWGTPIQLSVTTDGTLHLRSAGPDKIFGTADDITSQ